MRIPALAVLTLLAACAGRTAPRPIEVDDLDEPAPAAATSPEAPGPAWPDHEPIAVIRHPLVLVDAGAEPRTPLALRIGPGHREAFDLVLDTSRDDYVAPTVMQGQTLEVVERDGDGLRVRSVIDRVEWRSPNPRVTRATLTGLATRSLGTRYDGEVSTTGTWRSLRVTRPGAREAERRDGSMTDGGRGLVPLPTEAIGIGARWRVGWTSTTEYLVDETSVTYTLVARDGDRAVIQAELRGLGKPNPEGPHRRLPSTTVTTGTLRFQFAPDRLTQAMTMAMRSEITMGGLTTRIEATGSITPRRGR